jgi:excisionase family DNA binding protein
MAPEVLTAEEAAQLLRVSPSHLYEMCRQGVIPHRRLGRRIIISRQALMEWLAQGEERIPETQSRVRPVPRRVPPLGIGEIPPKGVRLKTWLKAW